jgi:diacylglycerol diphosphate phosphatase/phosphatidate phosphatase
MIAISRCEDYRHDVWDVTAGAFLGSTVAYFTYRRYYPPLRDRGCHVPYDLDAKGEGFAKLVDDEERLLHANRGCGSERGSDQESLPMHVDVLRN